MDLFTRVELGLDSSSSDSLETIATGFVNPADPAGQFGTTEKVLKDKKKEDIQLPPCRVCGSTASGFHFGVITCEACKVNNFLRNGLAIIMVCYSFME